MNFPSEPVEPFELPTIRDAVNALLLNTGGNRMDYLAELESESAIRNLNPDFGVIAKLGKRGLIVTARAEGDADHDFVSRFFAPAFGIDEDPVTGSAHCALAPYWSERLGQDELLGYQASRRGGYVRVRVAGDRVHLGGEAVTVFAGEMRKIE